VTGKTEKTPAEPQGLLFHDLVEHIPRRIVVFSGKGGVGKTTVAVNLAYALRNRGCNVGLLDADVTGPNVLQMAGVTESAKGSEHTILPHEQGGIRLVSLASMLPEGAPVIWRGPMRSKVIEQFLTDTEWGDIDTLIVDLPPGTGDEVLTIAQRLAPQVAVVVTTPQQVARLDAHRAVGFARKLDIPRIGLVENMSGLVCPHCGKTISLFGSGTTLEEAKTWGVDHFGIVPMDPDAPAESDAGTPHVLHRPESALTQAFLSVSERVLNAFDAS